MLHRLDNNAQPDIPAEVMGHLPMIQWYPGHIAKVERTLKEHLKLVDLVIEVVDARIPNTTLNPRLRRQYAHKPILLLLNKADFAEPAQTRRWEAHLNQAVQAVIAYEALSGKQKQAVINTIVRLGEPVQQKLLAQGRKRRPLRILVAGMPNVGKSTIINSLVGKKKTKTGHKAGVTRATQWVRIHPQIELMDSPGIIPPSLESPEAGALLACVHSVGEAAFEEEAVAQFLLDKLQQRYPNLWQQHFQVTNPSSEETSDLLAIAQARNYKLKGDEWDILRTARAILHDFRQGLLGKLTLEVITQATQTEHDRFTPSNDGS